MFKTVSKTVRLAMATYLGLHDEEDGNGIVVSDNN